MRYVPKHRRPTTSARKVAMVAAAAAATAAPVLAVTGPANAANSSTWDRLAMCESSGNWSINTGNSFYGGLQFTQSTWAGFGGTQYAARADLATRTQQIAIAEKVLAVQGWNAWPSCSRQLGLTSRDARASRSSARPVLAAPSVTTSSRSTGASTSGSYTVKAGDTLSSIASRLGVSGGWQALYAANRSEIGGNPGYIRIGMTLRVPGVSTGGGASSASSSHGSYTVHSGDTLFGIASSHHVAGGWQALYAANRSVIGGNPNAISVGQHLRLP